MFHIKSRVSTTAWKNPYRRHYVRLAPMNDAYMKAMMMGDVGERHLVFDLWFFCTKVKTCKLFNWFFQRGGVFCIQTCEQWRENTSLKAEDKLRKGKLVRVAFRKPLPQVKLQAIMAATYPNIHVVGPVTIDALTESTVSATVSELQQQYGQYASFFSTPFPPTPCQIGKFQCCNWMRGGNPRCLDCEVSGFQWRDTAFPPPMPDPEDILHEAAERTFATGRMVTVQEVMAGYKA